jgi:hypothetical protein
VTVGQSCTILPTVSPILASDEPKQQLDIRVYLSIRTPSCSATRVTDQLPSIKLIFKNVNMNKAFTPDFERDLLAIADNNAHLVHPCTALSKAQVPFTMDDRRLGVCQKANQKFTNILAINQFADGEPYIESTKYSNSITYSISYNLSVAPMTTASELPVPLPELMEAVSVDIPTKYEATTDQLAAMSPVANQWYLELNDLAHQPKSFKTLFWYTGLAERISAVLNPESLALPNDPTRLPAPKEPNLKVPSNRPFAKRKPIKPNRFHKDFSGNNSHQQQQKPSQHHGNNNNDSHNSHHSHYNRPSIHKRLGPPPTHHHVETKRR